MLMSGAYGVLYMACLNRLQLLALYGMTPCSHLVLAMWDVGAHIFICIIVYQYS